MTIKSFSFDQEEILLSILRLNNLDKFDVDLTYGNGMFYKNIAKPDYRYDLQPLSEDVEKADSRSVPLPNDFVRSVVFDPPFLTYIRNSREHNSIMARRFSGYYTYGELSDHYMSTLKECHRILKKRGILVFKCQDIVHNHKLHPTHINVTMWANDVGFRLKDLFVLAAKNRMGIPNSKLRAQKHARIFHSYFLVFEK